MSYNRYHYRVSQLNPRIGDSRRGLGDVTEYKGTKTLVEKVILPV